MKKGGRGTRKSRKVAASSRPRPSVVSAKLRKTLGARVTYERLERRDGSHARVYTVRNKSQKLTVKNVKTALKGLKPISKAEKGRRVQIVLQRDGRNIGTLKYTSAGDLATGKGWQAGFESWIANTRYQSFSAIQVRVIE